MFQCWFRDCTYLKNNSSSIYWNTIKDKSRSLGNIDTKGVRRGACENCDCNEYQFKRGAGPSCYYCTCPPTKHVKLDQSLEIPKTEPDCKKSYIIQPVDSVTLDVVRIDNNGFFEIQPAVSQIRQLQDLASLLPARLPKSVEAALQNKTLTNTLRCRIVRAVADRCFAAGVEPQVINKVADLAVDRWSALQSEYGHKSRAFAVQVKRRIAKLRQEGSINKQVCDKKMKKESAIHDHNLKVMTKEMKKESAIHDNNLKVMTKEMQKVQPCRKILKGCLDAVRSIRSTRASTMSPTEHLKSYPALACEDLLLWEFCSIVQVTITDMENRWSTCLKALEKYLDGSPSAVPKHCISDDMKTIHVLSILPVILPSGKKTKGASKLVLEFFPENTSMMETVPRPSEPPRLIGIGNTSQDNLPLTCYLGMTPLFTKWAVNALLMLLATYWTFGIEFSAEAKPSYLFLSAVILQDKFNSPYLSKSPTVNGLLRQLSDK